MKLLKEMCMAYAPSGNEGKMSEIIKREIKDYTDEIYTDNLGNLIAHKKGNGKRLMFCANSDSAGFVVTYIEENGFIRFRSIGSINPIVALSNKVVFESGDEGVIFYDKRKDLSKLSFDDMYIDIGAYGRKETEKYVNIGDSAVFCTAFCEKENIVSSAGIDNRAGCRALVGAIKNAKETNNDIYAVFTSRGNIGSRGAAACSYSIEPDIGIAIDAVCSADVMGENASDIKLGGGVVIKLASKRALLSCETAEKVIECAQKNNILYQRDAAMEGGSDAGAIISSLRGVKTAEICVPVRYIKTPYEMADINDIKAIEKLTQKLMETKF